ncbi:MAG: transposase [Phycisphaerae bacterium]|nr:transposase [Phycisphaerae bacterium]
MVWTFTCPDMTVYRVDEHRSSKVVQRVLGETFTGVLVSDCLSSYNPATYRKRIAHHLRAIEAAVRVEPTNNRAERSLRPAVIARKLSWGNKTNRGRRSREILARLGATYHQTGQDVIRFLARHAALKKKSR